MKMSEEYRNKYLNLIKFRIKNKLPEAVDFHLHHIVPKFLNPKRNSLIRLTPKEHCLAHYYLWRGFAKSKNKIGVKYLFNAYKGLSVAFGNDNCKTKRMKQFKKEFEQKTSNEKGDKPMNKIPANLLYSPNELERRLDDAGTHLPDDKTNASLLDFY